MDPALERGFPAVKQVGVILMASQVLAAPETRSHLLLPSHAPRPCPSQGKKSGERHGPKLIREGPADLEAVQAEASAKPSLTLGNTRSKTKSLSLQTLPSRPQ